MRKSEQLPLAFGHEPQTGRDDLLVSQPVSAAVSIIDRWPDWPSPVTVIVGPPGSGKSHLANIWRARAQAVDIHPIENDASADGIPAGRPVLFEDADRRGFDDRALFHLINSVRENGASLLITSRLRPASWPVALADLRSRLRAATVIEIGKPDDALLAQVLVKLFADRQLAVDDRLIGMIVSRMERSLDAARTLVERIDRLALARGTRISRLLIMEALDPPSGKDAGAD